MVLVKMAKMSDKFLTCVIYTTTKILFIYTRYIKTWYPKVFEVADFEFKVKIYKFLKNIRWRIKIVKSRQI